MKSICYIISFSLFFISFCGGAVEVCKTPPFKNEAKKILEVLGYSPSCSATALELCQKQCKTNFESALKTIKDAVVESEALVKLAVQEFSDLSMCLGIEQPNVINSANCQEIQTHRQEAQSGIASVYPFESYPDKELSVYCDQSTDEGGWLVIQRRDNLPIRENFYRNWTDYVNGFGNLTGEFWLGLEAIHSLTSRNKTELRIDLEDADGNKRYAKYSHFLIADESTDFKLTVDGYAGDAGDSMAYHNGRTFYTYDKGGNTCPKQFKGAWWYGSCHDSNLNGFQYVGKTTTYADGIVWDKWHGDHYSLAKVSMMIRPVA